MTIDSELARSRAVILYRDRLDRAVLARANHGASLNAAGLRLVAHTIFWTGVALEQLGDRVDWRALLPDESTREVGR